MYELSWIHVWFFFKSFNISLYITLSKYKKKTKFSIKWVETKIYNIPVFPCSFPILHPSTLSHFPSNPELPVVVNDSMESMGNGQNRAVLEFLFDGVLDEFIRFHVNCCRGFVQNEDFCLSKKSTRKTHQLPLSHAKVITRRK